MLERPHFLTNFSEITEPLEEVYTETGQHLEKI